jgi:hypothetical protein
MCSLRNVALQYPAHVSLQKRMEMPDQRHLVAITSRINALWSYTTLRPPPSTLHPQPSAMPHAQRLIRVPLPCSHETVSTFSPSSCDTDYIAFDDNLGNTVFYPNLWVHNRSCSNNTQLLRVRVCKARVGTMFPRTVPKSRQWTEGYIGG